MKISFRFPTFRRLFVIGLFSLVFCGCKKQDENHHALTSLEFPQPAGWPTPQYNFSGNPLTKEGVALGKKLFFDGRLSKDGNFPCSSCHQPEAAFANYDHDFSHGFNHQVTTRNAPSLINLAWHREMHHDGAVATLDQQPVSPITAPNEMAETIPSVLEKLNADSEYKNQFKNVFGKEDIDAPSMMKAISQFLVTLVSAGSKYDRVMASKDQFDVNEAAGYVIFKEKCNSCHKEPLFTDLTFRNNGLPINLTLNDIGRMRVTGSSSDSLKFKVPTLRNIIQTFPYMHDGRLKELSSVYEHYNSGVVDGPTTDPILKNRIPLTSIERSFLTEFLKTLTDSAYVGEAAHPPH